MTAPSRFLTPALFAAALLLAGCGDLARLPAQAAIGPAPQLPPPTRTLIPTVNIAPARGWPAGGRPRAAPGLSVTALATGLDHPRWLHVLPNGDVLVAESNKPEPEEGSRARRGPIGWVKSKAMAIVMKRAGAGVPSADRITLLRDADGDGVAEVRHVFLDREAGLHSPFGMALVGNDLYVANANGIVRYPYRSGDTRIHAPATPVTDLPAGLNHHWTKALIASPDGSKLYATVGSNSNVGENGMEIEEGRAAIWEVDRATGRKRLFASGLRNPNGMGWEPSTGVLWTVVNERDEIGSDLVPDYLTSVRDGGFYGWPWSYFGGRVDTRVKPLRPERVGKALVPDYALGNHVAPLGLAFAGARPAGAATADPGAGAAWPPQFASGAFIGQHGSWNRRPLSGYNVVFVPFTGGKPAGMPVEVLGGFLSPDNEAWGRPVGVAMDLRGALLVADDVGNAIWRVAPSAPAR